MLENHRFKSLIFLSFYIKKSHNSIRWTTCIWLFLKAFGQAHVYWKLYRRLSSRNCPKDIWCVSQNMKKYLTLKKQRSHIKIFKLQNVSDSENEVKYSFRQLELTLQSFLATKEMFLSFFYEREINEIK